MARTAGPFFVTYRNLWRLIAVVDIRIPFLSFTMPFFTRLRVHLEGAIRVGTVAEKGEKKGGPYGSAGEAAVTLFTTLASADMLYGFWMKPENSWMWKRSVTSCSE